MAAPSHAGVEKKWVEDGGPVGLVGRSGVGHWIGNGHVGGDDLPSTTVEAFPSWLQRRADLLSAASNDFFERLRGGLPLPVVVSAADVDVQLMEAAE